MAKNVKPLCSISVIFLFVLFALASEGPDASTNTTVAISDCEERPAINQWVVIRINYKNKDGAPIGDASGTIFVTEQTAKQDSCTATTNFHSHPLYTDVNGYYGVSSHFVTQRNSEDLTRVEVVIEKNGLYQRFRDIQVGKYGNFEFTFNCVGLRHTDL